MEWNLNSEECTGCCACADICPVEAISMRIDALGSRRPQLNSERCVSCGKCKRICPQISSSIIEGGEKIAYIGICDISRLYEKSSSGGIFAAVAYPFLERGGIVYGAAINYQDGLIKCQHTRITTIKELYRIQGSKYVQSKMDGVYKQVKDDLRGGKMVLFSGTSCQVDAIKKYIGEHDNLYTIDLVCHGVPKDKIFNDYIDYIESKYKTKIEDVSFRVKNHSSLWSKSSYVLKLTSRRGMGFRYFFIPKDKSAYFKLFLTRAGYRESCYHCKYASLKKASDLTLGDFRPSSMEKRRYSLCDNKTYSSIIVHNTKGKTLLGYGKSMISVIPMELDEMVKHHSNLQRPSSMSDSGKQMLGIYLQKGIPALQHQIDRGYLKEQIINIIKGITARKHRS